MAQKRATRGRMSERRNLRSGVLADALRLQLEACRKDEGLAAIVVSDELGFCVAHSGCDGTHHELAARLPMLVGPAAMQALDEEDHAELWPHPASLTVTTFSVGDTRLHACAVGVTPTGGSAVLDRVATGFTRLLAE